MTTWRCWAAGTILVSGLGCASAQKAATEGKSGKNEEASGYADVVPEDAETDDGLFSVHRVDEQLLFEIPAELFGRDFLLVTRIARVPADMVGGFIAAGHKTG